MRRVNRTQGSELIKYGEKAVGVEVKKLLGLLKLRKVRRERTRAECG